MRKSLFVLASSLMLAGCIQFEDFSFYWYKAGADTRLIGRWRRVAASADQAREHGYPIGDLLRFNLVGDVYEMSTEPSAATAAADLNPLYPVKTLDVGPYQFLVIGERKGLLQRYKLKGDVLEICMQNGPAQWAFVEGHYPNAVNIKKNQGEGTYLTILRFDDEVYRVLAAIPEGDWYWPCEGRYDRVR